MKRAVFLLVFLIIAVSSYAQRPSNSFLFIDGTAEDEEHLEFFLTNFNLEAATAGYKVTDKKREAAFSFKFIVSPNMIEVQGNMKPAPPDDNQYVINISIVNNKDNKEIVAFDFYFTDLLEVYDYTQFLFHKATVYIPAAAKEDINDRNWQNKWLYFRASFEYPVIFHRLQETGLHAGQAVYVEASDPSDPTKVIRDDFIPLDHKIQPQPGIKIGLEFQFLYFMSFEANFHVSFGDTTTYYHINMAAGGELKFPIKTRYLVLEPYGAFVYNINSSSAFKEFPLFALGGGLQLAARAGRSGAVFLDINYLHSFTEAVLYNTYGHIAPEPPEIYYKRFVLGLAVGYKYGIFNRRILAHKERKNKPCGCEGCAYLQQQN